MTSSTTLYTSPGNAGNVASQNFTTLYSGSGSINPTQPYGNANVVGLLAASTDGANTIGVISATGNIITDAFFIGDGGLLSNIAGGNIVGNVLNAQFVTNPAQANITSVGVLTSLSATGNVTASYVIGNGSLLSNITGANVTGAVANATFATTAGSATTAVTVTGNAQANITSVGTLTGLSVSGNTASGNLLTAGVVSATGNITGNYILGNGSQLTGLPATYGNANVTALLSNLGANSISTTGNVTAANFFGNVIGNIIGNVVVPGSNTEVLINDSGNIGTGAGFTFNTAGNLLSVPGPVSAVGNITGNYILGNGSQLTGLPATYGNANVVSLMAAFGSNSISTTGNVDTGKLTVNAPGNTWSILGNTITSPDGGSWRSDTTTHDEYIESAPGGYMNLAATHANGVYATQLHLEQTIVQITADANTWAFENGNLTLPGNTFAVNYANGTPVSLAGTYGNANVSNFLATFGSNSISTTGNVTASYVVGNGSLLTNITGANVTGTVSNATTAVTAGTVTGNAQANITSVGTLSSLSVSGNTTTGNLNTAGSISATGNVTAANFFGNVTGNVSGNIDAAGSNTQVQFNDTGDILGASAGFTFDKTANAVGITGTVTAGNVVTGGTVSATGNVQAGNVRTAGIVSATGNVSGGNLIIGSDPTLTAHLESSQTWNTANITTATSSPVNPGRITIGTGYAGNYSAFYDVNTNGRSAAVFNLNKFTINTANVRVQNLNSTLFANVAANIGSGSAPQTRLASAVNQLIIGGGTAGGNSITSGPQGIAATISATVIGGTGSFSDIGIYNASTQYSSGILAATNVNSGSNIGTGVGAQTINSCTVNGAANALIGFAAISSISGAGNLNIGVYIPTESGTTLPTDMKTGTGQYQATSNQVYGNTTSGFVADYYGIRIDSNLAKQKLGSINTFHETNLANTSVTGSYTVNKNNGQVQSLYLTGNTTLAGFSNMITSANISGVSATYYQADTVTLMVRPGASGYTFTMPTGAAYKYAGNIFTVGNTANSVTMISATAVYNQTSSSNEYLITVSPEFV